MAVPTVVVTCNASDQGGDSVAFGEYTAKLDQTEVYAGFVVPETVTVTANAEGVALLNLWPNALGVNGSSYRITARNPDTGRKFFDAAVVVPNNPCNLFQIIQNAPFPNVDSAQQALISVQALVAIANQDVLLTDDDRVAAEIAAAQALTRSAAAALSEFEAAASELRVDAALLTSPTAVVLGANLAAPGGAGLVGFLQSGTGAVARTTQDALRDSVSVFSFMTDAQKADVRAGTALLDVTDAWHKAQDASDTVLLPAGTHLLTNFRPKTYKKFIGVGRRGTRIKQGDPAQYAYNALSDAATGQLISIALEGVHFIGAPGATVGVFNAEANGPYVVYDSDFDFSVENSFQALRVHCPDANNVYNCRFRVSSAVTTGISAQTNGVYNTYDLFLTGTGAATSLALHSFDWNATFVRAITEAAQIYSGQNCTINGAVIENWTGAPYDQAIWLAGYNNTLVNTGLTTVPNAKANVAYKISHTNTILCARVIGDFPGTCPQFSLILDDNPGGTIADFRSSAPTKVESTSNPSAIRNMQWVGDCSTVTASQRVNGAPLFIRSQPVTGATVAFTDNLDAIVLQPAAAIAALTITLPANPLNGQINRVSTSQAITTLTVTATAGQSMGPNCVPSTLAAGGSFAVIWESAVGFWWAMS